MLRVRRLALVGGRKCFGVSLPVGRPTWIEPEAGGYFLFLLRPGHEEEDEETLRAQLRDFLRQRPA